MSAGRWDGAIPLDSFSRCVTGLGADCRLRVIAEDAVAIEDGVALVAYLDRVWGPSGDLVRLGSADLGDVVAICWDSVLLLGRSEVRGIELDVARHCAVRTGPVMMPGPDALHALAAELVVCELMEAGCLAVQVDVGAFRSAANRGIHTSFGL